MYVLLRNIGHDCWIEILLKQQKHILRLSIFDYTVPPRRLGKNRALVQRWDSVVARKSTKLDLHDKDLRNEGAVALAACIKYQNLNGLEELDLSGACNAR